MYNGSLIHELIAAVEKVQQGFLPAACSDEVEDCLALVAYEAPQQPEALMGVA